MVYKKGQVSFNKGRKFSEEYKKKLSDAQKKAWGEGKYTKKRNEKIRKSMSKLYVDGKLKIGGKKLSEHPNWKGGVSFIYHTERQILMSQSIYKIWRELVFQRDNFTCQNPNCEFCENKIGKKLNAHHIKSWKEFPELRFKLDNGITYCEKFHQNIKRDDVVLLLEENYGKRA